jgi:hypothetical protein
MVRRSAHRTSYLTIMPERAGNALVLSLVDGLDDRVAKISFGGGTG